MALKKHHKIIIGSFSSLIIIFMIVNSIFIYMLFTKLQINYTNLKTEIRGLQTEITELQTDTQSKLNELTTNLLKTQKELNSLGSQVGSIDEEINLLKASTSSDFSGIIGDAIKSVVTIRTDVSQGTGFIINSEGYIVTNAHVIENARSAGIYTYDNKMHQVMLIGYDLKFDIALLKIQGEYERLEFADSGDVQPGEKVIAIGNPLGLQFSVSEGIVSATHRPGPSGIKAYIQTDAALNPGNSGGPLINKKGKVIGINNFKIGGAEGMGFALESDYIKEVINEISQEKLNQTLI